jgi:hypothetical protein
MPLFDPEDGKYAFFQYFGSYSDYTALYPCNVFYTDRNHDPPYSAYFFPSQYAEQNLKILLRISHGNTLEFSL